MSRDFSFKQFTISQKHAAFKVGTDSVVLGAWVNVSHAKQILDIGTGTGLLALMCAQRNPTANLTAIEKDEASCNEAIHNFSNSPWCDRLSAKHTDIENYYSSISFDYIICNPPYFLNALLPDASRKADARHASYGFFDVLVKKVDELMAVDGIFGCILPYEEFEYLSSAFYKRNWNLTRTQKLWPYPGGNKLRVLAEWKKDAWVNRNFPDIYVRDSQREFSNEYKRLTQDFYLGSV